MKTELRVITFTEWGWTFKLQVRAKFAGQDFIPHQGEAREAPVANDVTCEERQTRTFSGEVWEGLRGARCFLEPTSRSGHHQQGLRGSAPVTRQVLLQDMLC